MVEVFTYTYNELFDLFRNISVPEYQRPYLWSNEKVDELLTDLEAFFITRPNPDLEYYMGSILFYQEKSENKWEIIDGQQRLTTLILIQYVLDGQLKSYQNLSYNNHISFYNIKRNLEYLEEKKTLLKELNQRDFFSRLKFSLIICDNKDNAFAFFDSQNNRGVTLGADDYLKAYHLREVYNERLQEQLAQEWERIILKSQKETNHESGLQHLFYKILYRARKWKGQTQIVPEGKDVILKSFQKQTIKSPDESSFELFPGRMNQRYKSLKLNNDNTNELVIEEIENHYSLNLPFTIRQPLFKGHNFFLFTQRYHGLHQYLFSSINTRNEAVTEARAYYDAIYTDRMSVYLRHYMQLCMVIYYDTFGEVLIGTAIKYFDYLIGSIRIDNYYVKKESVKKSLMNNSNNLLDVIANAYLPREVFDFIKEQLKVQEIYEKEKLENDKGVRNDYKRRVLSYFKKNDETLKDRIKWIV